MSKNMKNKKVLIFGLILFLCVIVAGIICTAVINSVSSKTDTISVYFLNVDLTSVDYNSNSSYKDIEDMFDIQFECENIDTINGFLIDKMGRIPQENEDFQCVYKGYEFKVVEVNNRMITKVFMTYIGIDENIQEEK